MGSKFKYRLTQKANDDLDDIVRYVAIELANQTAAADFLDKLQEVVEETCLFPESGFPVINRFSSNAGIRRKLIGNYTMYYLPDFAEEQILVLRIVYGKRDIDEILRALGLQH